MANGISQCSQLMQPMAWLINLATILGCTASIVASYPANGQLALAGG